MISLLLPAISAMLLVALVAAPIFSQGFRKDVLANEGEATVFGVLSVRGVVIVVLSALFLGGLVLGTRMSSEGPIATATAGREFIPLITGTQAHALKLVEGDRSSMRKKIHGFMDDKWTPTFLKFYITRSGVVDQLARGSSSERGEILVEFTANALEQVAKQKQELLGPVNAEFDKCADGVRGYYHDLALTAIDADLDILGKKLDQGPPNKCIEIAADISKALSSAGRKITFGEILKILENSKAQ